MSAENKDKCPNCGIPDKLFYFQSLWVCQDCVDRVVGRAGKEARCFGCARLERAQVFVKGHGFGCKECRDRWAEQQRTT
jgi:hypothetical protein